MEENKKWEEEIEILVIERLSQIFKKIISDDEIKEIKLKVEIFEEKLENTLKEKLTSGFNLYLEYEEINSEYISKLLKNYYKQGVKDGVNLIINSFK